MPTNTPKKHSFHLPRWFNLLVVLIIAGFLTNTLLSGWDQVRSFDWDINIPRIGSAFLVLFIYFIGQAALWSWSIRQLNTPLPYWTGMKIYITSQLAKYIPGGIWSFANVAVSAKQTGLSPSITVFMFVVNMVLTVWAAGLCALPVITAIIPGIPIPVGVLFAAALVISVVGGPWGLRWALHLLVRWRGLTNEVDIAQFTTYPRVIFLLLITLLLQIANCLSFYLYLSSLIDIPSGDQILAASAWSAAWFIGFIILFMPSGLGVREVSLTFLLGSIMSPSVATAVSLGHRVLLTALDLFLLLLIVLGSLSRYRHSARTSPQQAERN